MYLYFYTLVSRSYKYICLYIYLCIYLSLSLFIYVYIYIYYIYIYIYITCSDNETFDSRCNDLEKWIMERGYNKKMIRKQILSTREHSRNDLLEKEKQYMSEKKTFNITY